MGLNQFNNDGFLVTAPLLHGRTLLKIQDEASRINNDGVGTRNLLQFPWCESLARTLRDDALVREIVRPDSIAVQCTYFEKSGEQNWLVPLHQDLSIPVQEKIQHAELNGWSEKEGTIFVQAPDSVLRQMVAVRFHLDDCGLDDGPLRVVSGSHRRGRINGKEALLMRDQVGEIACTVDAGAVLLMKPLLLHASSKTGGQNKRRVLHFVFGPPSLPFGLKWKAHLHGT